MAEVDDCASYMHHKYLHADMLLQAIVPCDNVGDPVDKRGRPLNLDPDKLTNDTERRKVAGVISQNV